MWIDIEDGSGVRQGPGPITTATGWRQAARLKAAGEFSFVMPANDSRAALVQTGRIARCYEYDRRDGVREVGAGRIERKRTVVGTGGERLIQVSGCDRLGMLRDRTVGLLAVMDESELAPDAVSQIVGGSGTDLPNAYDGDAGTEETVTLTWPGYPDDFLYVEHPKTFHAISFDLGGTVNATVATLKAQFYNEESGGWEYVDIESDGTAVAGAPFAQDGKIEFGDPPKGWGPIGANYIIRLYVETTIGAVDFAEITCWVIEPTADALDLILAFAPAGWSLDVVNGYAATGADVYLSFAGESVLTALVRVAETLGENFILGAGKTIIWLQDDETTLALRAVGPVDGLAAEEVDDLLLIQELRAAPDEDAEGVCSRVLPWGGGIGTLRPTLAETTRSAPAGFTLSTTGNYLLHGAAEAAYGRIEQPLFAQDVVAADTSATQRANAADALFDRAIEYLRQHNAPLLSYEVDVVKCATLIQPGYLLTVRYDEWVDGYHSLAIDEELWIVEVTRSIGEDGVHTTGLRLATADRLPDDGLTATVATMQAVTGLAGANPPQVGRTSSAQGIPTYLAVEEGLVTTVSREVPVADGVYDTGQGPLGNMGSIQFRGGVPVAIVEAT